MAKETWIRILRKLRARVLIFSLALGLFVEAGILWLLIGHHFKVPFALYFAALMMTFGLWRAYRELQIRIYVGLKS